MIRRGVLRLMLILVLAAVPAAVDAAEATVRDQLSELAEREGIVVHGLERVGDEPAAAVAGDTRARLSALLHGYNFIVFEDGDGGIRSVRILGPQPAPGEVPRPGTVTTARLGDHHQVEAILTGPGGAALTASMMIDTGASTVVLPESMIAELGFETESLKGGWSKTANGKVEVKNGVLDRVQVGSALVDDVAVSFIADASLGDQTILGMSFLRNFKVSIDNANGRVTLTPR